MIVIVDVILVETLDRNINSVCFLYTGSIYFSWENVIIFFLLSFFSKNKKIVQTVLMKLFNYRVHMELFTSIFPSTFPSALFLVYCQHQHWCSLSLPVSSTAKSNEYYFEKGKNESSVFFSSRVWNIEVLLFENLTQKVRPPFGYWNNQ